jgi:hypothetical protein
MFGRRERVGGGVYGVTSVIITGKGTGWVEFDEITRRSG